MNKRINKSLQNSNALMLSFQKMQVTQEGLDMSYSVACTFIEIYNESITDLVNPDAVGLAIRDDKHNGGLYVDGTQEVSVVSGRLMFISSPSMKLYTVSIY